MAGDWIKMRVDLSDDPAVISMACALDLDEFGIVGRLHKLWSWADKHCSAGHAKSVTNVWIDRYIGHAGFAQSMVDVGWLTITETGVEFPNFDRHNGASAKTRAEATERKRQERLSNLRHEPVAPLSQKSCDKSVTREEKRREEETTTGAGAPEGEERRQKRQPSDADFDAARWLFDVVLKINPEAKKPKWDKWAGDVRLLRESDGRTHRQICELFKWAKSDPFWSPNIQSPAKLRDKWDTLTEKKNLATPEEAPAKKDWI